MNNSHTADDSIACIFINNLLCKYGSAAKRNIHLGSNHRHKIRCTCFGMWCSLLPSTAGTTITSAQLPRGALPAFLAVGGFFDAEWRVLVACREGRVYTVKARDDK